MYFWNSVVWWLQQCWVSGISSSTCCCIALSISIFPPAMSLWSFQNIWSEMLSPPFLQRDLHTLERGITGWLSQETWICFCVTLEKSYPAYLDWMVPNWSLCSHPLCIQQLPWSHLHYLCIRPQLNVVFFICVLSSLHLNWKKQHFKVLYCECVCAWAGAVKYYSM